MEKADEILKKLNKLSSPKNLEGMARFGIRPKRALGISIPQLRKLAKETGKNHKLALKLWKTGIHEARLLAGLIDEVGLVTSKQMDNWIKDFDSWDICDLVLSNLFDKTPYAHKKAIEWTKRKPEYEKRAGYALMACLAIHDKSASDAKFIKFFPAIKQGSSDERNYVKKAVNWAIRQIGKRNKKLNKEAIKLSQEIRKTDTKAARWITADALRELTGEAVQKRLSIVRSTK